MPNSRDSGVVEPYRVPYSTTVSIVSIVSMIFKLFLKWNFSLTELMKISISDSNTVDTLDTLDTLRLYTVVLPIVVYIYN